MKKTYEKPQILAVAPYKPALMLGVSPVVHSYQKGEDITVGDTED